MACQPKHFGHQCSVQYINFLPLQLLKKLVKLWTNRIRTFPNNVLDIFVYCLYRQSRTMFNENSPCSGSVSRNDDFDMQCQLGYGVSTLGVKIS